METKEKLTGAGSLAKLLQANVLVTLTFLIYCAFIVASTADLDFVVSKTLTLPIINLSLPLIGVYVVAALLDRKSVV